MSKDDWNGPLFIVGFTRSGTKLLREILNRTDQVGLPSYESKVLPYFFERWNKYGDMSLLSNFARFYHDFERTVFAERLRRGGEFPSMEFWHDRIEEGSFSHVFKVFFQDYAVRKGKRIWGDKSPSYMKHMPLLKRVFPEARFIHIIRDGRDVSLSVEKSWGKSPYDAACRWNYSVRLARGAGKTLDAAYLEVRYEDLLDAPHDTMQLVCKFVGVDYSNQILEVSGKVEGTGDARGVAGILTDNRQKWKRNSDRAKVERLERIASECLRECGYELGSSIPRHGGVVDLTVHYYRLLDRLYSLRQRFAS